MPIQDPVPRIEIDMVELQEPATAKGVAKPD
jgi:hypothetical protein